MKPLAILTQVSPAFHEFLKQEAKRRGVSMSYLVRQSVVAHLCGDPKLLAFPEKQEPSDARQS